MEWREWLKIEVILFDMRDLMCENEYAISFFLLLPYNKELREEWKSICL